MDKRISHIIAILLFCLIFYNNKAIAVEAVVSHQRGFYNKAIQVIVEATEPNATIQYTINGSKPSINNSLQYSRPILINTTTTLRVLVYNEIDTTETVHSYIYLNEIRSAPYMSNHIIQNQSYIPLLDSAFQVIPCMAVTIPNEISVGEAIDLEQIPASVEMFFPQGNQEGFYSPCGIKTWGGSPSNPKKNYRLIFRKIFGAGKLKYDVFDDDYEYAIPPVDQFDNLLLRAGSQDGLNAEYNNEANAQFIRNRFVADIAMEMGYPAPHGRFVHLFLNGAYAGHYHLMERPDEHFFQTYIFSDAEENSIEVKKNDVYWNLPDPAPTFYETLLSYSNGLTSKLNYEKLADFINVDGAADYITFHQFIGNFDWHDQQNTLLGAIPEKRAGPFEFVVWDVDFSLGNKGVLSIGYEFNKHGAVPENLFNAKEFKFLQGDKVECLCKNDGILTPHNLKEKYRYRANQVEISLIAEAARWGNNNYEFGETFPNHKAVENWEVNTHWQAEFDRVYGDFLNNRTDAFIQKYINLERYSSLQAVKAKVSNNTIELSHENDFGTVVYMLNGDDPRAFGGALNPNAVTYNSQPIPLEEPVELKARFYKNTSTGRKWSHLCPQKIYPAQPYESLVINELHIQPNDQINNGDSITGKHFEFIELKNTSNQVIFLQDIEFDDGVDCQLNKSTRIEARGYFVIAADSLHFIQKYGFSPDATFKGKLNNRGETLRLIDPFGNTIDSLTYAPVAPWPVLAELTDQSIAFNPSTLNNYDATNWAVQSVKYTPGEANQFCDDQIKIEATLAEPSCYGNSDGFIIPDISGGTAPYQFKWSDGSTAKQLTNLAAGNYSLSISDDNDCSIRKIFNLQQPEELTVLVTQQNTLRVWASGGIAPYQYQWSNGERGTTLQSFSQGVHQVTVSDQNACTTTAPINFQEETTCKPPGNIKTLELQAQKVSLTWDAKSAGSAYFIRYKKLSDDEPFFIKQNDNTITLSNLEPCTTYEVGILTICSENENSNFSSNFYFKTSGCTPCPIAQNLSNLNSTSGSIFITWDAVPELSYLLYYKTANAQQWYTFETLVNFAILFNLDACQTYEWKVAVKCNTENISTQSEALQFTSGGCKLNEEIPSQPKTWEVYPNPAKKMLFIQLNHFKPNQTNIQFKLYDASAKLHLIKEVQMRDEKVMSLNVSSLNPGFYYLHIWDDKHRYLTKKIQIYTDD